MNRRLLLKVAESGKTVIMSVGMATLKEIEMAYDTLRRGTKNIALLHCISSYPTKEGDANLAAIYTLKERFDCIIGQSDHTNNIVVPLYAVAAGAQIIEKHYMIDDNMECVDGPVSITEEQMKKMIGEIRRIEKIFGTGEFGIRKAEKDITVFRRYS